MTLKQLSEMFKRAGKYALAQNHSAAYRLCCYLENACEDMIDNQLDEKTRMEIISKAEKEFNKLTLLGM